MYQYRTISPGDLSDDEAQAWSALCLATPEFLSPLLGPDFARLVGRWRPDAEITVVSRRDGEPVGFFAYHRRPGRVARPIGAPFSDVQAVVSHHGALFTGAGLLRASGLERFKYQALVDPYGLFPDKGDAVDPSFTIDLPGQAVEASGSVIKLGKTDLKKWSKHAQRLTILHGDICLDVADADLGALRAVFDWKSRQLARNGLQDFLAPRWVQGFMLDAFARQDGQFRGRLLTLRAGDTLLAGRFGVEANGVFHPWVSAYNPAFADYAPGNLLLWKAIEALPSAGVIAIELGGGLAEHKRRFSTREELVRAGALDLTPQLRHASPIGPDTPGAFARLSRRLDQIALLEPSWPMRAASVITALARAPRRVGGQLG